jgi:hypothetical protein
LEANFLRPGWQKEYGNPKSLNIIITEVAEDLIDKTILKDSKACRSRPSVLS